MLKWSELFRSKNEDRNLEQTTVDIVDKTDEFVKKGVTSSMNLDNIQNMSSEDIEMMRMLSAIWSDSKVYAIKVAAVLDQIPEIKKEQETIKKQLAECQSLLREIARREA